MNTFDKPITSTTISKYIVYFLLIFLSKFGMLCVAREFGMVKINVRDVHLTVCCNLEASKDVLSEETSTNKTARNKQLAAKKHFLSSLMPAMHEKLKSCCEKNNVKCSSVLIEKKEVK